MSKSNSFRKEMKKHLHHLLLDESPYEPSLVGDTIAVATSYHIRVCEKYGIEKEALEFVKNNPNLTIEDLDEFLEEVIPAPIVVEAETEYQKKIEEVLSSKTMNHDEHTYNLYDYIFYTPEKYGVEDDVLDFIDKNPEASFEEIVDFVDSLMSTIEVFDEEDEEYD